MRAVVQRVQSSKVTVEGEIIGEIGAGLLVLLGVTDSDTASDAKYLAAKIANLRIFEDDKGKMNRSVLDIGGSILSVSQFTLYGDCRQGRRPSFTQAANPVFANNLYEQFNDFLREEGVKVAVGKFQAHMEVALINDGPVTMLLDSGKNF